mmetsp:Transcript_49861/g.97560  ORF Transcript_49861/g.97560 Transcript_49861/m.97560 type:complete len:475 (+) Transcript_49861:200-1624(+)
MAPPSPSPSRRRHHIIPASILAPILLFTPCVFAFSTGIRSPFGRTFWRADGVSRAAAATDAAADANPFSGASSNLISALARIERSGTPPEDSDGPTWHEVDVGAALRPPQVLVLNPKNSRPDAIVLFLGGAALGKYPRASYGEFLSRISTRCNAAVISAPYDAGLDHFALSAGCGEALREGLRIAADKFGWKREGIGSSGAGTGFDETGDIPVLLLGHSLGAKIIAILAAAVPDLSDGASGVGLVSYNNFGVTRSVSMARDVAGAVMGAGGRGPPQGINVDSLFDLVGAAVSGIGVEFSPSPTDMDRLVSVKFGDGTALAKKVRLFAFDDDDLDCTDEFVRAATSGDPMAGGTGEGYDNAEVVGGKTEGRSAVSVSGLPGGHLAPVFVQLGLDDLDIPEEAQNLVDFAASQVGGGEGAKEIGASFGDENLLDAAVDEVAAWIRGEGPTRPSSPPGKDVDNPRRSMSGVMDVEFD